MKALTAEALQRFALKKGARLELDGKPFNASRLQVVTSAPTKAPPPAPKPEPTPAPAPAMDDRTQIMLAAQLQLLAGIKAALEATPGRARVDRFDIERDADKLLKTINVIYKE